MTRDDILRMAKEAGLQVYSILEKQQIDWNCLIDDLQEFAALVAAAEREACAKVCDARVGIWIIPAGPKECADAIRARSKT